MYSNFIIFFRKHQKEYEMIMKIPNVHSNEANNDQNLKEKGVHFCLSRIFNIFFKKVIKKNNK